mgnify:CR=1 FL=1
MNMKSTALQRPPLDRCTLAHELAVGIDYDTRVLLTRIDATLDQLSAWARAANTRRAWRAAAHR